MLIVFLVPVTDMALESSSYPDVETSGFPRVEFNLTYPSE